MKRLVGIYREKECSPGRHKSNDSLLLEAIAQRLRASGFAVDLIAAPGQDPAPNDAALIFSMCQGRDALLRLVQWERNGATILNSPAAALNTHRDHLPAIMEGAGIPFPRTHLFETENGVVAGGGDAGPRLNGSGLWLKRGDVHASVSSDVQWIPGEENLNAAIAEFRSRGITHAAVQSHCAGDEIKFYGVGEDGFFFHWFYSRKENGCRLDEKALADLVQRAVRAAGLTIYGGDVIVDPEGNLTLIDLNDWPSFAPCREAASEAIAEIIRRRIHAD